MMVTYACPAFALEQTPCDAVPHRSQNVIPPVEIAAVLRSVTPDRSSCRRASAPAPHVLKRKGRPATWVAFSFKGE
jgi:hypothetical protein